MLEHFGGLPKKDNGIQLGQELQEGCLLWKLYWKNLSCLQSVKLPYCRVLIQVNQPDKECGMLDSDAVIHRAADAPVICRAPPAIPAWRQSCRQHAGISAWKCQMTSP